MIRRLLCKLGLHDWEREGTHFSPFFHCRLTVDVCKHCGAKQSLDPRGELIWLRRGK